MYRAKSSFCVSRLDAATQAGQQIRNMTSDHANSLKCKRGYLLSDRGPVLVLIVPILFRIFISFPRSFQAGFDQRWAEDAGTKDAPFESPYANDVPRISALKAGHRSIDSDSRLA